MLISLPFKLLLFVIVDGWAMTVGSIASTYELNFMEFDANIEHLRLAFWNVVLAAGPILGIALAIGLFIGIIQAAHRSMK